MLSSLGIKSSRELFSEIPNKLERNIDIPQAASEIEVLEEIRELANKNKGSQEYVSFLGAGNYNHYIPSAVKQVCSRSEWYTAYTPYQAEASQGTLQAIFEYQTLICNLAGMDAANASMYDGATAMMEAAILARNVTGRNKILVFETVHPNYREVLKTYAKGAGFVVQSIPFNNQLTTGKFELTTDTAGIVMQQPNFFGTMEEIEGVAEQIHSNGSLFIVSADPISLGMLKPPGEYGADVVVGEGQPLGNPQNFGGPGLGIFAVKEKYLRLLPGRLAGMTNDKKGRRGFCLTLQTREQHIRRERAGSNICSNQAFCALTAAAYLTALGPAGLKQIAELSMQKAHYLAEKLAPEGLVPTRKFFREFAVKLKKPIKEINKKLLEEKIIGGLDLGRFYPGLENYMLIATTELIRKKELDRFAKILKG